MATSFEHARGSEDHSWEGLAGGGIEHPAKYGAGPGPVEMAEEERARAQKNAGRFAYTIEQIRVGGAEQLATYLGNLSEEVRNKIDGALNMQDKGIVDLFFVDASHQEAAIRLLNKIVAAQESKAIREAAKDCADQLENWKND